VNEFERAEDGDDKTGMGPRAVLLALVGILAAIAIGLAFWDRRFHPVVDNPTPYDEWLAHLIFRWAPIALWVVIISIGLCLSKWSASTRPVYVEFGVACVLVAATWVLMLELSLLLIPVCIAISITGASAAWKVVPSFRRESYGQFVMALITAGLACVAVTAAIYMVIFFQ
jgi:hypothetical protein